MIHISMFFYKSVVKPRAQKQLPGTFLSHFNRKPRKWENRLNMYLLQGILGTVSWKAINSLETFFLNLRWVGSSTCFYLFYQMLFRVMYVVILPSDVAIIINHYKDPIIKQPGFNGKDSAVFFSDSRLSYSLFVVDSRPLLWEAVEVERCDLAPTPLVLAEKLGRKKAQRKRGRWHRPSIRLKKWPEVMQTKDFVC